MKEIIITGANGFVGKNLTPYIEDRGFKVTKLSLRSEEWTSKINKNAHAIIHLAGLAHDLKNTNSENDYFLVNTELTKALFEEFKKSEINKFIYFSSVKAVADYLGDGILDENFKPSPYTPYGKSKLKAEEFLTKEILNLGNDKFIYILRPSMIHGPENKGNLNVLFKFISRGVPYPLGAFNNKRTFLSIDNLNFIILKLCSENIKSGIYNACDSESLSTLELVELINASVVKKSKVWKINKNLINMMAKFGSIFNLPFNSDSLNKLIENYMVSNHKILKEIGEKLPVSAKEGITKTLKSFLK